MKEFDLSALFQHAASGTAHELPLIRLDGNATLVIPFTTVGSEIDVHFCHEADIKGYARCSGEGCLLCQVGKRRDKRILLPVYAPVLKQVAVLAMGTSIRPGALAPQFYAALQHHDAVSALAISREDSRYSVEVLTLPDGADEGAAQVKQFLEGFERGHIDLDSVFPLYSTEDLARVPEIATMLQFRK